MLKKIFIVLLVSLLFGGLVLAVEKIKYDFDEVEVVYASEFEAVPVNISADNWIVKLSGGVSEPIQVLFGQVKFRKAGIFMISEEFIKVSGKNGSERFLVNSQSGRAYSTGTYSQLKSFFWSAKKVDGLSILKDKTLPINSITLHRKFNENQEVASMILFFSNDGETAGKDFWTEVEPNQDYFTADLKTLKQSSNLAAGDAK